MAPCAGQWGVRAGLVEGLGKAVLGCAGVSGDSEDRAWGLRCYCWDHSSQREPDCGISEVTPGDEEMRNTHVPCTRGLLAPSSCVSNLGHSALSSKPQSSLIAPPITLKYLTEYGLLCWSVNYAIYGGNEMCCPILHFFPNFLNMYRMQSRALFFHYKCWNHICKSLFLGVTM